MQFKNNFTNILRRELTLWVAIFFLGGPCLSQEFAIDSEAGGEESVRYFVEGS